MRRNNLVEKLLRETNASDRDARQTQAERGRRRLARARKGVLEALDARVVSSEWQGHSDRIYAVVEVDLMDHMQSDVMSVEVLSSTPTKPNATSEMIESKVICEAVSFALAAFQVQSQCH
ncbi:hypothetical protein [Psychromarinibacter sp. S121]|uniref:hypothetical protein n=1 Tax=Psychromarinibacter sp. S121 TaxID=3415127 RepID=UPI003C7D952D